MADDGRGGSGDAAARGAPRVLLLTARKVSLVCLPAVVVIVAVIIFPWIFTVFMSLHDWQVASPRTWVGLDNYANLFSDERFRAAIGRTFIYTLLAVISPSSLAPPRRSSFTASSRSAASWQHYILPMVATPAAIALVWTMMFHPSSGSELPVDPCRSRPRCGSITPDRHSVVGSGGNVAVEAAGDADCAWRFGDAATDRWNRLWSTAPAPGRSSVTSPSL